MILYMTDHEDKRKANLEKRWAVAKDHYEKAYRVVFKVRPTDEQIEDLCANLKKLNNSEYMSKER